VVKKARNLQSDNLLEPPKTLTRVLPGLSQPVSELGAGFFFTNFSCGGPLYDAGYQTWLNEAYLNHTNHALRAAIEAAGLAGISNIYLSSEMASHSKARYVEALAAMKHALEDPAKSVADITLLTVIFLGLYEVRLLILPAGEH
jgi:hypothetical protein